MRIDDRTILRLAAATVFIQALGHGLLFVTGTPGKRIDEISLTKVMRQVKFTRFGFNPSYWDFYFGYGLMAAFTVLIEAILFWQLSRLSKTAPAAIRPIAALFIFANAVHFVLIAIYFDLLLPAVFDMIIVGLLTVVYLRSAKPIADAH